MKKTEQKKKIEANGIYRKKREIDNHRYGVIKKKLKMWKEARGKGKLTKRKIK